MSDDLALIPELGEPSKELLELSRQLLGESPDTRANYVEELSDMIYEKGEVVPYRMDEEFLIRFLRARHFDVKRAYQLFVNYHEFKSNNPTLHRGVSPWDEKLQYIGESGVMSILPYRDQLGRRILVYKIGKWNTGKCTIENIFQASLMVLEFALLEQRAQIVGGVCFFDMEGLSMKHTWQVTPKVVNNVLQLMGLSFPIRLEEVHILNQPRIFDLIYTMFKPFLNKKMRSVVHFHGKNFETLHKFIDPQSLPEIYGGTRGYPKFEDWFGNIMDNPVIKKELDSLGYLNEKPNDKENGANEKLTEPM